MKGLTLSISPHFFSACSSLSHQDLFSPAVVNTNHRKEVSTHVEKCVMSNTSEHNTQGGGSQIIAYKPENSINCLTMLLMFNARSI